MRLWGTVFNLTSEPTLSPSEWITQRFRNQPRWLCKFWREKKTQLLTSFSAPVYHHLVPAVISVAVAQTSLCKRFFDKLTKSLFSPPLKKTLHLDLIQHTSGKQRHIKVCDLQEAVDIWWQILDNRDVLYLRVKSKVEVCKCSKIVYYAFKMWNVMWF